MCLRRRFGSVLVFLLAASLADVALAISRDEAIETLRIEASKSSGLFPRCDDSTLGMHTTVVNGHVQRAEWAMARATAGLLAGQLAGCALKDLGHLVPWSEQVGQMLALSAIAGTKMGLVIPANAATAARADLLLNFAAQNGSASAAQAQTMLHDSGFVREPMNAREIASSPSVLKATTKDVAEKFAANPLSFRQQYSGKAIEATGPVIGIFDGNIAGKLGATVILTGIPRASKDDVLFRDEVECRITSPDAIQRAGQLQVKQVVAARGVYDPSRDLIIGRIVLHDCRVE